MKEISLNGKWKCKPDFKNMGIQEKWHDQGLNLEDDNDLIEIDIPNSFNILEGYEIYEGVFWHFYRFYIKKSDIKDDADYSIRFKGGNYNSKAWLNGVFLGENDGGFLPFYLKINESLKSEENLLVVRTDNTRRRGQLPDIAFDWFNWGGLYRGVDLLILNKNRVADVRIKTTLKSRKESEIIVNFKIIGKVSFKWQILNTNKDVFLFEGTILDSVMKDSFSLTIQNPKLWSPDTPYLYHLRITSTLPKSEGNILFESHFGIRQIETNGPYLYLNKRKIYLKAVCLHEEYMPYGRAIPYEKREEDVRNMKSLGLNALRTAHYSHDEDLIDITDKLGLLVLEELPVYWDCEYKSNKTFRLAAKMMRTLIKRDFNHPSVIMWSTGNEVPIERIECAKFFKRMIKWTKMQDDSRLVSYVSHKMFCDLTRRYGDVACFNGYFGWYYGSPRMINLLLDVIKTPFFNKPWLYTEFGAGAKFGYRPGWKSQIKFSEERQLYVLDYSIRTFNSKDYLAGWFLWAYRDFRAFLRQNEFQQGYNRKGIVSGEKNEKKLIYYRIPQIIDEKRDVIQLRIISIIIWAVIFPLAYIFTYVADSFLLLGQRNRMNAGKRKEEKRQNLEKKD